MYTLNCNGNLIDLSTPRVMGIVNCTPDSFYDGGKTVKQAQIIAQATTMLKDGATFLDVGGYSSRPDASEVPIEEEIERVVPAIKGILKEFPHALISIDTFRSEVAKNALEAGACMVNDISGGLLDPKMISLVSHWKVPYIMMHMRGTPKTMKTLTEYTHITQEVLFYFSECLAKARDAGINDIIIDPGFGFAKTTDQNFELLHHLENFQSLNVPILVGLSRKSMIYKTINNSPKEALNGTTALHAVALTKGASILRAHDVKEAIECVLLTQKLKTNS